MKKLSAVICVILIGLLLFGCADETLLSKDDPVVLNLWHVYGEQADAPMNRLVKEFNDTVGLEKGIIINVTNVTSTSKIGSQLLDSQANNPGSLEMPDLFTCHTSNASVLGPENLIDWNEVFTEDELSGFVKEFVDDGILDEKLVVFPVSKSTYALFVNGNEFDRFSQATGVTYEDLSTWKGFFDAAEKYYNYSGGNTFCVFDYFIRHIELDVLSSGEELEYTENGWYDPSSTALKNSWMMFARSLVSDHIAISDPYANTQMMTGESLTGIGSSASIIYFNDTVTYPDNTTEPMKLKVVPLPHSEGSQQYMPQTGVGLAAYRTDDKKAEAAEVFVRWFTESERNLDFVASTGYMPVNNAAYDMIDEYEYIDDSYRSLYEAIRTMRENCTPVVRPTMDGYYKKTNALYAELKNKDKFTCDANDKQSIEDAAEDTWDFFMSIK